MVSLLSPSYWLVVSIDPEVKESFQFCEFLTVVAEQVQGEDLVVHKILLSKDVVAYNIPLNGCWSKSNNIAGEWLLGSFWWLPKTFNRKHKWQGRIGRSTDSCKWNYDEKSTALQWVDLLVQVWRADWWLAGFYRAWSCKQYTSLRPMRCLALWPMTPLSQVMSPTSSTSPTTKRPLKFSSRSNPATRGPRTYMTRRSVTRPSA